MKAGNFLLMLIVFIPLQLYSQLSLRLDVYRPTIGDTNYSKKFVSISDFYLVVDTVEVPWVRKGENEFIVRVAQDSVMGDSLVVKMENNKGCFITLIPNFFNFYTIDGKGTSFEIFISKSIIIKKEFKGYTGYNAPPHYYIKNRKTLRKYVQTSIGVMVYPYKGNRTFSPPIYPCDDYYQLYRILGNKSPFNVEYTIQK